MVKDEWGMMHNEIVSTAFTTFEICDTKHMPDALPRHCQKSVAFVATPYVRN